MSLVGLDRCHGGFGRAPPVLEKSASRSVPGLREVRNESAQSGPDGDGSAPRETLWWTPSPTPTSNSVGVPVTEGT